MPMSKVLIAEDDPVSQHVLRKTVEDLGHTVFVSPDGKHAFDALMVNDDFDLLIADILMPHLDGRELVMSLRGSPRFRHLPIIMMSGVVSYREIQNLLEIGATYFLPKPVRRADLAEYIDRCLSAVA
jgi:CheY-like chemotaxis protein